MQKMERIVLAGIFTLGLLDFANCQSSFTTAGNESRASVLEPSPLGTSISVVEDSWAIETPAPLRSRIRQGCESPFFLFGWPGQSAQDRTLDLDEPLITDRPDFTEASSTVGKGVSQWEVGYTFTSNRVNGIRSYAHSYPEVLLRQGFLQNWFEIRVGLNVATTGGWRSQRTGYEDLYLGAKIGLLPQQGILPEMSVIPQATFPTGSRIYSNGDDLYGVNLLYSWEINDRWSLGANTQFNQAIDDVTSRKFLKWAQSVAVGMSLTDRLGLYSEWYALMPSGADTVPVEHYFNTGLTRLYGNDFQRDIRFGMGLNGVADDFFVGTGFSVRCR